MKGTRPLDNDEIRRVSTCFTGTFAVRNRGLFMLGVSTGGRISELLSLTIGDVYQNKKPVTDLLYSKSIVKGGEVSRSVPVNADGRRSIDALVNWHWAHYRSVASKRPLFPSRHKSGTVPMHRQTAHAILKNAFIEAGLNGHIATHSLRKSFAQRLYDKTGDIYMVQELLGHKNISTTQKYLGVNYADAKAAVELIALMTESDRIPLSSRSLEEIDDETLQSELTRRGYNVTKRRENETTAEIVIVAQSYIREWSKFPVAVQVLIEKAKSREIISYGDLAREFKILSYGDPMSQILGSIVATLYELGQKWKEDITVLVVSSNAGYPTISFGSLIPVFSERKINTKSKTLCDAFMKDT